MPLPSQLRKPHALVFPWPSQGHINPMLMLANCLASAGALVTVVHYARSYSLLFRNKTTEPESNIRVEVLEDGMSTDEKQKPTFYEILESGQKVEKGLEQLIQRLDNEENPVSCLICDNFLDWAQDVAKKFGIPRVEFWTSSATVYSMGCHIPHLMAGGYLPFKPGTEETVVDFVPGLLPFRLADLPPDFLIGDVSNPLFQFLCRIFSRGKEAERVLVHSFYDLERSVVDGLRRTLQVPIDLIGPLIPWGAGIDNSTDGKLNAANFHTQDVDCLKWLDAQADCSVIYVAFGSAATLSVEEIQALALGLQACKHPFLWVIRPDAVKNATSNVLPEGFESRTKERSLIISWAPQLAVLAHPSVGGFLTHCGWNSTLESLWMGVPMIGCPRQAEQNTNMKCIIEWKVGMAVKGGITQDSVEGAIEALMQGEEGREARGRGAELKEAARKAVSDGGHSHNSLQKLVEDMKQMVRS